MLQVLKDSYIFFRINFLNIFKILLPILIFNFAFILILEFISVPDRLSNLIDFMEYFISLIFHSVYSAGLIFFFDGILKGEFVSVKESLLKGLKMAPLVLLTDCIVLLITGVGFLLLIIPGIILSAKLSLTTYCLLLSKDMPLEAIKNSYELTKGYTKSILGCLTIVGLPYIIIFTIIPSLFKNGFDSIFSSFVIGIISNLFSAFLIIILFRFYCLINEKKAIA
ncbi:MAG: YciC family protein [Desulfobacterales bacterium]|nr:YciC family protein [Desulfobacterales bacterium]MDD4071489.1 YciC family protein [Desulfobacterales bacterium]MDD4392930.1 YciC family protein [Desulfobacterales bacterium]